MRFGILHWSYKCCLCTRLPSSSKPLKAILMLRSVCSGCLGQLKLPNSPLQKLTLATLLPEVTTIKSLPQQHMMIFTNLFFLQFSLSSPSPLSSSTHQPSPSPLIRNTFGRFSFRSSKDAAATSQGLTRLEKRVGTKTKSLKNFKGQTQ